MYVSGYMKIQNKGGISFYLSHVVRKPAFGICEIKAQIRCTVTVQLISAFVFAT